VETETCIVCTNIFPSEEMIDQEDGSRICKECAELLGEQEETVDELEKNQ
jgi:hypothetical protein